MTATQDIPDFTVDDASSEYTSGMLAYQHGLTMEANPHEPAEELNGSSKRYQWFMGFLDAKYKKWNK